MTDLFASSLIPNLDIDDLDKAYLAGFLDADGCFTIVSSNGKPQLRMSVYQTKRAVLDYMREIVGGLGYITDKGRSNITNHPGFIWMLSSWDAGRLAKTIGPFMIKKKAQAKIAILFAETLVYLGNKVPMHLVSARNDLRERMLEVNNSGKRRIHSP